MVLIGNSICACGVNFAIWTISNFIFDGSYREWYLCLSGAAKAHPYTWSWFRDLWWNAETTFGFKLKQNCYSACLQPWWQFSHQEKK